MLETGRGECSGPADLATASLYAELGVQRYVVFAPEGDLDKLRGFLDGFRREVMERFAG